MKKTHRVHLEQIKRDFVSSVDKGIDNVPNVGFLLEKDAETLILKHFGFDGGSPERGQGTQRSVNSNLRGRDDLAQEDEGTNLRDKRIPGISFYEEYVVVRIYGQA